MQSYQTKANLPATFVKMVLVAVLLITNGSSADTDDTDNHIRHPLLITGCSNLLTLTTPPPLELVRTSCNTKQLYYTVLGGQQIGEDPSFLSECIR